LIKKKVSGRSYLFECTAPMPPALFSDALQKPSGQNWRLATSDSNMGAKGLITVKTYPTLSRKHGSWFARLGFS